MGVECILHSRHTTVVLNFTAYVCDLLNYKIVKLLALLLIASLGEKRSSLEVKGYQYLSIRVLI